jgi:hypothetical protein
MSRFLKRCIFCKTDSSQSTSVEHIIPESLGNTKHTLPKGVVCDKCNNYFSRKIENKVLSSRILQDIRSLMQIPSKKGKIPHLSNEITISFPDYRIMARFLGKIGLEVLTQRVLDIYLWENEIIDKPELDELRYFVRYNKSKSDWIFYYRTLHPINSVFHDRNEHYEILHEYDLLYTDKYEIYIIVSIFGVEFSLNLGGPNINGYLTWLKDNNNISPLYSGNNSIPLAPGPTTHN